MALNIRMAGIDYTLAGIDDRQAFAFDPQQQEQIYRYLAGQPEVFGAVLLTTCNRTELYLSCREDSDVHPFALLCKAVGLPFQQRHSSCTLRQQEEVFCHLHRLACGAASQIWGEDQIITQVKEAIARARACQAADSILEVLFRTAITGGKAAKSSLRFVRANHSIAHKVAEVLNAQQPRPQQVLIIGNGEMGRLNAHTLLAQGFGVAMTLRQYKYGRVAVPEGALTFPYAQRYAYMPEFDAVISATTSPHLTVEAKEFCQLAKRPRFLVDLAVPRDIDPDLAGLSDVIHYDIDSLGQRPIQEEQAALLTQIDAIGQKYYGDFLKWDKYRRGIPT